MTIEEFRKQAIQTLQQIEGLKKMIQELVNKIDKVVINNEVR